jgi:membrane-associated PAP2 superfamily phosphatase
MPSATNASPATTRQLVLRTLGAGLVWCLWDLLGQDLAMARWFGTATGFPYSSHWLFASVLHEGARRVAWALQLGLVMAIWWPVGPLCRLPRRESVHLALATLLTILAIWPLKSRSLTSCPWDLKEFGGVASSGWHSRCWRA